MTEQWNEPLRCPRCRSTGIANLSQPDGEGPTVYGIPAGFKVVKTQYGPTFYCAACDISTEID